MENKKSIYSDSKVHVANMGPTWVLSAPGGPHFDPMNLAIRDKHCWVLTPRQNWCPTGFPSQYRSKTDLFTVRVQESESKSWYCEPNPTGIGIFSKLTLCLNNKRNPINSYTVYSAVRKKYPKRVAISRSLKLGNWLKLWCSWFKYWMSWVMCLGLSRRTMSWLQMCLWSLRNNYKIWSQTMCITEQSNFRNCQERVSNRDHQA